MVTLAGGHDDAVFYSLAIFVPGALLSSSQAYLYCQARPWCGRWFMALGFLNLLAAIICAGILAISATGTSTASSNPLPGSILIPATVWKAVRNSSNQECRHRSMNL
jgi:hypothetical protein